MSAASSLKEKVRDLPLLCVETIFKFTPSSQLLRLHSNAVPLPGAFWSFGLKTVLKKRLPLSLVVDSSYYQAEKNPTVVFDANGANVASIKHPEAFRFSPILELIESALLILHVSVKRNCCDEVLQFYVRDGEDVLSNLQNVKDLSLVLYEGQTRFQQRDLLASNLKHLLPQLESLVIKHSPNICYTAWMDQTVCNFLREVPLHEMSRLRRLHLPFDSFHSMTVQSKAGNCSAKPVLSGLSSLGIWQCDHLFEFVRAAVLRHLSTYCRDVTVLFVFVSGEFKAYLDAFRALTGLTVLGMNITLPTLQMKGLTFDKREAIGSVSDLRIVSACMSDGDDQGACESKILTFFPGVRALAIKAIHHSTDSLQLANSLFGERQLLPAVAKLSCFSFDGTSSYLSQHLMRFLANPHLPETVDLLPCMFKNLSLHAGYLTAITTSMQSNSIKRLLLRGPVHSEALARLQSRNDFSGEDVHISAWVNRDLGTHPSICNQTKISVLSDFTIRGTKASGSLKGEQFTILVFHQPAKRVDIFD